MTYFNAFDLRLLGDVVHRLGESSATHLFDDNTLATSMLRLFAADFLGTTHWDGQQRRYLEPRCFNRDDRMSEAYRDHFQFVDPLSPRLRRRRRPTSVYQAMSRTDLERTEYFNDFLRPNRVAEGIDLYLYDGQQLLGDLRVWRRPQAAPFGDRELTLLEVLRPHLLNRLRLREAHLAEPTTALSATVGPQGGQIALSDPLSRALRAIDRSAQATVLKHIQQQTHLAQPGNTLLGRRVALERRCAAHGSSPALQLHLLQAPTAPNALQESPALTQRERGVLALLARGLSDKAIARQLGISYWTVRTHVAHLMRKARVGRRGELAYWSLDLAIG